MVAWGTPAQALGYAGTACVLLGLGLLARGQRTSRRYWGLVVAGNALWLSAGLALGSGAVLLDALAGIALACYGWARASPD